ncbi:hypothetical protein U1707_10305 [Sphingomonas sp. PB2P12]|uniref:hypothetical protein n=1 Tax=Sphingomonas sandaracina TaxID=3096157 RepID=UPI002FC5AEE4
MASTYSTTKTVMCITPFPLVEISSPIEDVRGCVLNMTVLLSTVEDMVAQAKDRVNNPQFLLNSVWAENLLDRIEKLLWIASEERGRAMAHIDQCEQVAYDHSQDMRIAA